MELNQVSMQHYSSLPVLAGVMRSTKEVVVLPSKSSTLLQTAACSTVPVLFSSSPESSLQRRLLWEAKVHLGGTTRFCSWERPGFARLHPVLGAHCWRWDLKTLISQDFPSTLKNLPHYTSQTFPTCAHVSTQGTILLTSNCLLAKEYHSDEQMLLVLSLQSLFSLKKNQTKNQNKTSFAWIFEKCKEIIPF